MNRFTTRLWGLKVDIPGGALPSSLPCTPTSSIRLPLSDRRWIAPINRLPGGGFVVCNTLKQGGHKVNATKAGSKVQKSTGTLKLCSESSGQIF